MAAWIQTRQTQSVTIRKALYPDPTTAEIAAITGMYDIEVKDGRPVPDDSPRVRALFAYKARMQKAIIGELLKLAVGQFSKDEKAQLNLPNQNTPAFTDTRLEEMQLRAVGMARGSLPHFKAHFVTNFTKHLPLPAGSAQKATKEKKETPERQRTSTESSRTVC